LCLLELISGLQNDGFDASDEEIGGIVGVISQTLAACNCDIRRVAEKHIIFCGGGASIPGLPEAVQSKIFEMSGKLIGLYSLPFEKSLLAWIGGSIFASMASNDGVFIAQNYAEGSPSLPLLSDWMVRSTITG
jgi:actin-related protein